jgi:hypothetical protein
LTWWIDSIDFIKKSYCADYGTVRKFYDDVKTDIDVIDRFLIDGGADTFFNRGFGFPPYQIGKSQNPYFVIV